MNVLKKWWIWLLLVAVSVAGGFTYFSRAQSAAEPEFRTAKIGKGSLTSAVSASGTLQPVVSVQVGSQVSGQLKEVLVDFNTQVTKNQLIARIDPESFEYRVRQAEADMDAARAQVATQQAMIAAQRAAQSQIDITLAEARRDVERKQQLVDKNFISASELDKARATASAQAEQLKAAQAQVEVARANAGNAAAVVKQRAAALAQARIDLERTAIRAPVNGIVIKRSVDKGQTVAASLQAPELFIIAENLNDMRVDTAIDESEIGKIKVGQSATFTVDAFPGKIFEGTVRQVRKSAQVVSNVVTYLVDVSAPNPALLLLPGMTANVRIVTEVRNDVLKVPNAALRFRPPPKPEDQAAAVAGKPAGRGGRPGDRIFRLESGKLVPLTVRLGLSDGSMTEVMSPDVKEGMEVVVGIAGDTARARPPSGMSAAPRMF